MNQAQRTVIILIGTVLLTSFQASTAETPIDKRPVKVSILAVQSNMEGKAQVALLEKQIKSPATSNLFSHFRKDGKWIEA